MRKNKQMNDVSVSLSTGQQRLTATLPLDEYFKITKRFPKSLPIKEMKYNEMNLKPGQKKSNSFQ